MKLKKDFVTHKTDGEQLMISTSGVFNGMVRSNASVAVITDLLKEDTTRENIILSMLELYEVERKTVEADVDRVLASLRDIGAIDE